MKSIVLYLLSLCLLVSSACSSRILIVTPNPSFSHFSVFQPLLSALLSRGHELVVISSFPQGHLGKNYTEISIRGYKNVHSSSIPMDALYNVPLTLPEDLYILFREIDYEPLFSNPGVRQLLQSDDRFDLVITEMWNTDLFLGFGHRFKAPVVSVSSSSLYPWFHDRFSNPDTPSYISNIFLPTMGHLDFVQRLKNTLQLVISKFVYDNVYNSLSEKIAKRVFGASLPSLSELAKNVSLVLVNTHHSVHGAAPLSPQVVQIGGIHVSKPSPLPKDLEDWLSQSQDGFIYFSFGSIMRGSTLPPEKVEAFHQAFDKFTQRVLWKWEDDVESRQSNVRKMKWIPQRDVLAHPKMKVFISHGGLLGVEEAVANGVPVLGIPLFSDQSNNIAALVERGAAVMLNYNNISVTSLTWALDLLINDKSYSRNAKLLSDQFLDRPLSPLDTAVYWIEYVIKHDGAPHLRCAAVDLAWYQYYLLDVILFCVFIFTAGIVLAYFLLKVVVRTVAKKSYLPFKKSKTE